MITVEVNLPTRSLVVFGTWIIAIPPTVLAFMLARLCSHETAFEVPLYILGGFLACEAISKLLSGFFAHNYLVFAANWLLLVGEFVSGAYWISARLANSVVDQTPHILRLEIALMILWALNIIVSTNVQVVLLYGSIVDPVLVEKPTPNSLIPSPTSSQEEWRSVAELPGTCPSNADVEKSPIKILKTHRSSGSLVSFKRKHRNHQSAPVMPSLAGLEAVPEGFLDVSWDVGSNVQYMLQGPAGQRSVSGSTQQSGLFGAAEYNKRITSAGFVKHEPSPPPALRHSKSKTFGHYDREQTRLQEIL